MFGGSSITDKDNYPHRASQTGTKSLTIPVGATGGSNIGSGEKGSLKARLTAEDNQNFEKMKRQMLQAMKSPALAKLASHIKFIQTRDGMRIDLVDDADYSMFALGTTQLVPQASELIGMIAGSIKGMENPIMIRGHTDNLAYGNPLAMNNWMLSTGRAEATRRRLAQGGLTETRFDRIEGVADREPMIENNPADPRNRRVSITLLYRAGSFGEGETTSIPTGPGSLSK
jgi:chemotaxis protein MotB